MDYFIGIIPPDEQLNAIREFRRQWPANRIDEVVAPHITMKAQGGLTPDEYWLERVKVEAGKFPSFSVRLGEPRFFGEDILYLSLQSPELVELHKRLVAAVGSSPEQIAEYFELERFVPHLTLAKTSYGLSRSDLQEMAAAAKNELAALPEFGVEAIRIYRKSGGQAYERYMDLPLKNK